VSTFVLVHGSCHGGWCWKKLSPILRKSQHEVYALTLTGLGERSHLVSRDVSLNTHIQDVTQVFEYEDLSGVILVGHSYGGLVISGVAEEMANRIKRLVYLDGYIAEDGKSAFDLIPGLKEIYEKRAINEHEKEFLVSSYTPQEFGVTDPADIAWMKPRLSPMPWHTHDQPSRITNLEAKKIFKSYITCTEFGDFMINKAKSEHIDYHELRMGHDVMITAPNELAVLLQNISTQ
jgi:pimeloyl-ACP methyl ester carboxylesterase